MSKSYQKKTAATTSQAAVHADSVLDDSVLDAAAQLTALARELDKTYPGAAARLREGLAETLTVLRLGLPPTLRAASLLGLDGLSSGFEGGHGLRGGREVSYAADHQRESPCS
jgi:hypothetical protein